MKISLQEKFELLLKLQKSDKVMGKINEKWKRKRLINITYLIKRVLSETDESIADKIQLHLSEEILKLVMNGMIISKRLNNFIQNLYKILYYTFMKKPIQYSSYKSKNRRFESCIKDVNMASSYAVSFPKGFESVMEYQVIFQNRRIRDEKKISVIHQSHNFSQSHILSEICLKKEFEDQTTFDVTFITIVIIGQKRRVNIFTKLIMICYIIDNRLYHFIKRRYKIYLYFLSYCFTYLSDRGV